MRKSILILFVICTSFAFTAIKTGEFNLNKKSTTSTSLELNLSLNDILEVNEYFTVVFKFFKNIIFSSTHSP